MNEEQAINTLNRIKERSMLTKMEVELSNLCIKNKKIIHKQDELIKDYYDRMIKIKELIENDYFEDGSFKNYYEVMSLLRGEHNETN